MEQTPIPAYLYYTPTYTSNEEWMLQQVKPPQLPNQSSYLSNPTLKVDEIGNQIDTLYAEYIYRQGQREIKKRGDTETYNKNQRDYFDTLKDGFWVDYSGRDRSFRTVTGSGKDKKVTYDWGAGLQNTLGNVSRLGGITMSFIKDKDTAKNSMNDIATSARKGFQQIGMQSGNPYVMAAAALSMLSDKTGGTASATKGLGTGKDVGNFLASQVPFLGFLGKKMGKQFESDELKGSSMYAWNSTADGLFNGRIVFGGNKAKKLTDINNMLRGLATNILKDAKLDYIGAGDPRYYIAAQSELNGGYSLIGSAKQGAVLQFSKRALSKNKIKKQLNGGIVVNYKPEGDIEINLERTPTFEEWVKLVPKEYQSELYDLQAYYEEAVKQAEFGNPGLLKQLNAWLFAITRPTKEERDFYRDVQIPNELGELYNPYHLGSIIPLYDENGNETGEYMFVKLGTEKNNPELHYETDEYKSGKNGLIDTHNLVFEGDRYYYRLKNPKKFKEGGKVNVIPEGALHKNKHHLEEVDKKFEDVTTKGIPVIVESDGGEVVLLAEVERLEIIFRLEVTKKLEELSKKHTDEAAIEAGKLLVEEILYNTIDKTNNML